MVSGLLLDSSVFAVAVVCWPVSMKDHKHPSGSGEDRSRDWDWPASCAGGICMAILFLFLSFTLNPAEKK